MPVDYSWSTTCGSCLYCVTLALAGKGSSRHLCLKCQQLGLVSPVIHQSYKITSATIGWEYALFKVENALPSGNSTMSQRFAEEKYLC